MCGPLLLSLVKPPTGIIKRLQRLLYASRNVRIHPFSESYASNSLTNISQVEKWKFRIFLMYVCAIQSRNIVNDSRLKKSSIYTFSCLHAHICTLQKDFS